MANQYRQDALSLSAIAADLSTFSRLPPAGAGIVRLGLLAGCAGYAGHFHTGFLTGGYLRRLHSTFWITRKGRSRRRGRVAEGNGLLNRHTLSRRIEGSNPSVSANGFDSI